MLCLIRVTAAGYPPAAYGQRATSMSAATSVSQQPYTYAMANTYGSPPMFAPAQLPQTGISPPPPMPTGHGPRHGSHRGSNSRGFGRGNDAYNYGRSASLGGHQQGYQAMPMEYAGSPGVIGTPPAANTGSPNYATAYGPAYAGWGRRG